jgi:hypothetical protein
MTIRNDMKEPYVTITWCPQDLVDEYGLNDEEAMKVLDEISRDLENRSIELGWEVIETLIEPHLKEK